MNKGEVRYRGGLFFSLMKHEGWKLLELEVKEMIEDIERVILDDEEDNPHLRAKGERIGLLEVLTIPQDAVEEMERLTTPDDGSQ